MAADRAADRDGMMRADLAPFVPAKAGTQSCDTEPLGSRLRGNERSAWFG
jgi:hypothetical protein